MFPLLPSLQFLPNEKWKWCYCLHFERKDSLLHTAAWSPIHLGVCLWMSFLMPFPDWGWWGCSVVHTLLWHPCAMNPVGSCRGTKILCGEVVGTTTLHHKQEVMGISAGDCGCRQAQHPPLFSCRVLKGSSCCSFWSLPPLDESHKQWRRDESFCIPKAIP